MHYTSHRTPFTIVNTLVLPVIYCMTVNCKVYVPAQEEIMYTGTQIPDSLLTALALFNQPYSNCMSAIQSAAQRNINMMWG